MLTVASFIVLPSVFILNARMLSVVVLKDGILTVVMLSVVKPPSLPSPHPGMFYKTFSNEGGLCECRFIPVCLTDWKNWHFSAFERLHKFWIPAKQLRFWKLAGLDWKFKFERTKIKFLSGSLKSAEIDETEIAHRWSEWNWTKYFKKFGSLLFISVALKISVEYCKYLKSECNWTKTYSHYHFLMRHSVYNKMILHKTVNSRDFL